MCIKLFFTLDIHFRRRILFYYLFVWVSEELTEHYFFSENSFRCSIHAVVTFPLFDVFIMLVIVASSISLAAEVRPRRRLDTRAVWTSCSITCLYFQDPINVDGEWNKFLGKLDYGFTCIFAIEVLLKVLFTIYVCIHLYICSPYSMCRYWTTAWCCTRARIWGRCGTVWTWSWSPAPSPHLQWTWCKI